jgi:hypothetical protein
MMTSDAFHRLQITKYLLFLYNIPILYIQNIYVS